MYCAPLYSVVRSNKSIYLKDKTKESKTIFCLENKFLWKKFIKCCDAYHLNHLKNNQNNILLISMLWDIDMGYLIIKIHTVPPWKSVGTYPAA